MVDETGKINKRLELLGNFILSSPIITVKQAIEDELKIKDYFCWTDSQISLAWINSLEKVLKTFCQNRVLKIRENTDIRRYYCKSNENPADIITRFNDCDISKNMMWLHGPNFIKSFNVKVNEITR